MTMHINLSPEMENFIKGRVSSGFYGNATEVIRDAIRRLPRWIRAGPDEDRDEVLMALEIGA